MTSIDILLAVMIGGFGLQLSLLLIVWNCLSKLDDKVTDIDRRLCRIEGAMAAKDCCMLKDERHMRKAE